MSTWLFFALAIETGLQLLDRGARQHQSLMLQNVVDVGTDRREEIDRAQVRRRQSEADVERIAVDDESGLAEAELAELLANRLGLGLGDVQAVEDDQLAGRGLGAQ